MAGRIDSAVCPPSRYEDTASDKIYVLLVDDDPDLLDLAEIFLEREGLETETVNSAERALELCEVKSFDAIVSDYKMPEMDGLEFLERFRERDESTPFVIFTGKGREEVAMEALNLGADRYLRKGGDPGSQFGLLADAVKQEHERHRSIKDVEKLQAEKSIILDGTSEHVVYQSPDGEIIWANKAAAESVGTVAEDLVGSRCYEVWHGRDARCEGCPVGRSIDTGRHEEGVVEAPDGGLWKVHGDTVEDGGRLVGAIEIAREVEDKEGDLKGRIDRPEPDA